MNTTASVFSTTEASGFKFRNKFRKLLTSENQDVIEKGFQKFLELDSDTAFDMLWNMTYHADITYSLDKLGLNPEIIPAESISEFLNELRYQYKERNPSFLQIDIPENCKKEFETLSGHSNIITAIAVYKKIVIRITLSISLDLDRTMFLLGSSEENLYCGGLGDIGFYRPEIVYLKAFHEDICKLFKAVKANYRGVIPSQQSAKHKSSFIDQGKELSTANFKSADKKADDDLNNTCKNSEKYATITAKSILENKKLFSSLVFSLEAIEMLEKLSACGFDLNEIVKKVEKIKALLNIDKDLSA